jgi:hypothetical protein
VMRIGKRMAVMTILNSAGIILMILMVTPAVTFKNHMWVLPLLLWICHNFMSLTEIITVDDTKSREEVLNSLRRKSTGASSRHSRGENKANSAIVKAVSGSSASSQPFPA